MRDSGGISAQAACRLGNSGGIAMMKKMKIILVAFHVLSVIVCVFSVKILWERRALITATAEITFIGKPQGIVYCTYVDEKGVQHSENDLFGGSYYYDFRYMGHSGDVSSDIGKKVKIAYDPVLRKVQKDHRQMCYCHILSYVMSALLLFIYRKTAGKRTAADNLS